MTISAPASKTDKPVDGSTQDQGNSANQPRQLVDKIIAALRVQLAAKDERLSAKDAVIAANNAVIAAKGAVIVAMAAEADALRVKVDQLSFNKFVERSSLKPLSPGLPLPGDITCATVSHDEGHAVSDDDVIINDNNISSPVTTQLDLASAYDSANAPVDKRSHKPVQIAFVDCGKIKGHHELHLSILNMNTLEQPDIIVALGCPDTNEYDSWRHSLNVFSEWRFPGYPINSSDKVCMPGGMFVGWKESSVGLMTEIVLVTSDMVLIDLGPKGQASVRLQFVNNAAFGSDSMAASPLRMNTLYESTPPRIVFGDDFGNDGYRVDKGMCNLVSDFKVGKVGSAIKSRWDLDIRSSITVKEYPGMKFTVNVPVISSSVLHLAGCLKGQCLHFGSCTQFNRLAEKAVLAWKLATENHLGCHLSSQNYELNENAMNKAENELCRLSWAARNATYCLDSSIELFSKPWWSNELNCARAVAEKRIQAYFNQHKSQSAHNNIILPYYNAAKKAQKEYYNLYIQAVMTWWKSMCH